MAEGKWVQVQSKRYKKYRKIWWEDLISVFVSNLPENTTVDWLRSVFSPYGYIYDAFIPAKSRRGKGFCFGFVRFSDRETATRAVQSMNGRSVGGRSLLVKVASFGWSQRAGPRKLNSSEVNMHRSVEGFSSQGAGEGVSKSFVSKPIIGMSYSDAVKGKRPISCSSVMVGTEVVAANSKWLANSLIGEVKWVGVIPSILGLCASYGLEDVKMAKLGGNKILLSFGDVEEALSIFKEFNLQFSDVFYSLERWVPGPNLSVRTVWLRFYGVPLHAWNPLIFEEIGGRFGEVLGVAKETEERSELLFGRVCIKTESHQFLNHLVDLVIFGNIFPITIREEIVEFGCPSVPRQEIVSVLGTRDADDDAQRKEMDSSSGSSETEYSQAGQALQRRAAADTVFHHSQRGSSSSSPEKAVVAGNLHLPYPAWSGSSSKSVRCLQFSREERSPVRLLSKEVRAEGAMAREKVYHKRGKGRGMDILISSVPLWQ